MALVGVVDGFDDKFGSDEEAEGDADAKESEEDEIDDEDDFACCDDARELVRCLEEDDGQRAGGHCTGELMPCEVLKGVEAIIRTLRAVVVFWSRSVTV